MFTPHDDLFFCHRAFFARTDGVHFYKARIAIVFRWLTQVRDFCVDTKKMVVTAALREKEVCLTAPNRLLPPTPPSLTPPYSLSLSSKHTLQNDKRKKRARDRASAMMLGV